MFLYREEELIGKSIEVLVPETSRSRHAQLREGYIEKPRNFYSMQGARFLTGLRKDGKEVPIEVSLSIIEKKKRPPIVVANVTDVTEKYELKQKSDYDHLTRLLNRRSFDEILAQKLISNHQEMSIIMIDIDHFKKVNDDYGHLVGDEILVAFSNVLYRCARKNDVLCRWGGEEFMILAPKLNKQDLLEACERFRLQISQTQFKVVGHLTCSIGATSYCRGDTVNTLVSRADQALYQSKEAGRNQTVIQ